MSYELPEARIKLIAGPEKLLSQKPVTDPTEAAKFASELIKEQDREVLLSVALDNKLRPVNFAVVSIGTLNACLADPPQILKSVILSNAKAFFLVHCHPSGDPTPSKEDMELTERMEKAADILGLKCVEHLIAGCKTDAYFSFAEHGLMHESTEEFKTDADKETVEVSYYVHECSEFPNAARQWGNLDFEAAAEIYGRIQQESRAYIPSIGIDIKIKSGNRDHNIYDGSQIDLYRGRVTTEMLEYTKYLASLPEVQKAVQNIKDRFEPKEIKEQDRIIEQEKPILLKKPTSVDDAVREIKEGLKNYIANDERWKNFLSCMALFHNYSLNNTILIAMQKPDATRCASYQTWQAAGRQVEKGQVGQRVIVPTPKKIFVDQKTTDPETGETRTEKVEKKVMYYKMGTVFDISQTVAKPEGSPLDIVKELEGDIPDEDVFESLKKSAPEDIAVVIGPVAGTAKGWFSLSEREIRVRDDMPQMQQIKTMCHELGHAYTEIYHSNDEDFPLSRVDKEIIAESCAYIAVKHIGELIGEPLSSEEYSWPYLASWAETPERLESNIKMIKACSSEMIKEIDRNLEEIKIDKLQEATFRSEFGFICMRKTDKENEWHFMSYGKDYWGQQARFMKANGNIVQAARQIAMQLHGYTGPIEQINSDAFRQKCREAHPERFDVVKDQQNERRHSRR